MSKEVWLTYHNGGESLKFPVNPEELSIGSGSKNETFDVANLGEVTVIQAPGAKTYSFSSIFPATAGPYLSIREDALEAPYDYVDKIEAWKSGDEPVRFIVTDTNVNTLCSIEDFSYSEKGGDVDTVYYSLSLKEYKIITPRQMNGSGAISGKPSRPSPAGGAS